MSIQKKSLISTLKTAKKANVATGTPSEAVAGSKTVSAVKIVNSKKVHAKTGVFSARAVINNKTI